MKQNDTRLGVFCVVCNLFCINIFLNGSSEMQHVKYVCHRKPLLDVVQHFNTRGLTVSTFVFPSIENPSCRYRLYSTSTDNPADDWRRSNHSLSSCLSTYDTMGDGEVQHSPDCLVPPDRIFDFCESLACVLDLIEVDDQVPEYFKRVFHHRCQSDDLISFALGLKFNEKKDTYYNLRDRKTSHSQEKRHDKRWFLLDNYEGEHVIDRTVRIVSNEDKASNLLEYMELILAIAKLVDPVYYKSYLVRFMDNSQSGVFSGRNPGANLALLEDFSVLIEFRDAIETYTWAKRSAQCKRERHEQRKEVEA